MQAKRKIKARYMVSAPRKVKVYINKCSFDKEKGLQQETVVKEIVMYMVHFPQGHSIRVNQKELERLGYDKKPRMVDMETGDVIDIGGDPYDFAAMSAEDKGVEIVDDDDVNPLKTAKG